MKSLVMFSCCVGLILAFGCASEPAPSTLQPRLAPSQPNGLSELAGTMVAMDDQLTRIQKNIDAKGFSWEGQSLDMHNLMDRHPTDETMVNGHFEVHAPLYRQAITQFNASPSAEAFNQVVDACKSCHLGTCPGPLERIEKRRVASGASERR
jgi:hypothetical protein